MFGEVTRLGLATGWTIDLWSTTGGEITTAEGYRIGGLRGPEVTRAADLLIVPSWPETAPPLGEDLRSVLVGAHGRGAAVAGLCLGAIPLADSGLLARSAVTHWTAMALLRARHADIELESSVLYVDHDDVVTSPGTASAIDACLHLVRKYLGAEKANSVARQLVVAPHRDGGQAQYIERPVAPQPADDPIGHVQQWALTHLDEPLSVEGLASRARMSRPAQLRTSLHRVDRHFAGALGRAATTRPRADAARDHRPQHRSGRPGLRFRQRGDVPAELRRVVRDHPVGVSASVPRDAGLRSPTCPMPRRLFARRRDWRWRTRAIANAVWRRRPDRWRGRSEPDGPTP